MAIEEVEDIDKPADLALLGGVFDDEEDEPKPVDEDKPEVKDEKAAEPAAEKSEDEHPARDQTIPRGRFDEVNTKLKAERERAERLEAELAALKQPKEASKDDAPAFDLKAKRAEYREAIFNGDDAKAEVLEAEIDAYKEQHFIAKAQEVATGTVSASKAQTLMEAAIAKALTDHPELNENGGDNPQLREVVEWRDFYIHKGQAPHEALQSAVAKVMPAKQADPTPDTKADPRKLEAVKRNAEDSAAQPAAPNAGIGNRGVPGMPPIKSQDDWDKLPAAERERLLA